MINCILLSKELWSGFFGTIIGALIGGIIAYIIARIQIVNQEKNDKRNKEIQLLWQIYFDIKKDSENSNLWEKYELMLQKREDLMGTPTAEYIHETLEFIMRDLNNLLKLLSAKETQFSKSEYNEIDLLWTRASQLVFFMNKVFKKLSEINRRTTQNIVDYYSESNALIKKHDEYRNKN